MAGAQASAGLGTAHVHAIMDMRCGSPFVPYRKIPAFDLPIGVSAADTIRLCRI